MTTFIFDQLRNEFVWIFGDGYLLFYGKMFVVDIDSRIIQFNIKLLTQYEKSRMQIAGKEIFLMTKN